MAIRLIAACRTFAIALGLFVGFGTLLQATPARAALGITALSCTPPAADPEIKALARALNYDLALIYEYIYYNIENLPSFGLKKGPLSTYLDGHGNNMDQNMLFVTLLRQSCITANYRYGQVEIPANTVANLIGVDNTASLLSRALGSGAIPHCIQMAAGGSCVTSGGAAATVTVRMVWTEATVGSSTYRLDPSLKSYQNYTPITADVLSSAMGYSASDLLSSASSGSSPASGLPNGVTSVRNISKTNIVAKLNSYSEQLASYIKTSKPTLSMKEIFGGRAITNSAYGTLFPEGGASCTEISNCTTTANALRTVFTIAVSDTVGSASKISASYFADEISGKRLTLNYLPGNQLQLMFDGNSIQTGSTTTAANQIVTMTMSAPYYAEVLANYTVRAGIKTGGIYSIVMAAGETGRGTLTRQQQQLAQAIAAGSAASSEAVRGGSLANIAFAYLSQGREGDRLAADLADYVNIYHAVLGVVGDNGSVYVDFPAQLYSASAKKSSVTNADIAGSGLTSQIAYAALESTVVKQFQTTEAVSTPRMFDYSNTSGIGFIQATPGNWSSVKPLLTNWSANDLAEMESFLTATGTSGRQVIVPQNGARTVNSWVGNGYYLQQTTDSSNNNQYLASKITGNFNGGYATDSENVKDNSFSMRPQKPYPQTFSYDPIDLNTGYFLYDHDDIITGSADYPFGLTLKRRYNSGIRNDKTALGYGWRHNFMMSAFKDSDPYEAFGDRNPLAAVATVAAAHAMKGIMTSVGAPTLNAMVTASLTASWLMDQQVENAITVQTNEGTRKFARIPTAAGGFVYVPPPGDGSTLTLGTGNAATIIDKYGVTTIFDSDGQFASWKDKNDNTVTASYSGTGATKKLASVSNGMGRTLSFSYDGAGLLTSVSDGTRTINYSYATNGNLTGFQNALGNSTTYQYDLIGRMTNLYHPAFPSTAAATNVYDAFDRIKTQSDALGNEWHYLFANGYRSQEVNPLGKARTLYHDNKGNLLIDFDQTAAAIRYAYNGIGQRTKQTYPLGDSVSFTYDAQSNLLTKTTTPVPDSINTLTGNAAVMVTESWRYTSLSRPASYTDALGNVTSWSYDNKGNLTQTVKPSVPFGWRTATPTITTIYNSRGLPITTTDAESKLTAYGYQTTNFDLLTVTEDSGTGRLNLQTRYSYDTVGNRLTVTDPTGNTMSQTFDAERQLSSVTPPAPLAASVTRYRYNASGDRTAVEQATGDAASAWLTTSTSYNAAGKAIGDQPARWHDRHDRL